MEEKDGKNDKNGTDASNGYSPKPFFDLLKKAAKENNEAVFEMFAQMFVEAEAAKEELRRKGYGHQGLSLLRAVVDEVPESNSNHVKCPYCGSKYINYNVSDGWSCDICDEMWKFVANKNLITEPKGSECGCTINQACKACAQSKGINWDVLWDYSAVVTFPKDDLDKSGLDAVYKLTPQLRWGKKGLLQQLWVSDAGESEWRNVPEEEL